MEDSELVILSKQIFDKNLGGHELMKNYIEILSKPYKERIQYEFQFRAITIQLENIGVMNKDSARQSRKNYYDKKYNHITRGNVYYIDKKLFR